MSAAKIVVLRLDTKINSNIWTINMVDPVFILFCYPIWELNDSLKDDVFTLQQLQGFPDEVLDGMVVVAKALV